MKLPPWKNDDEAQANIGFLSEISGVNITVNIEQKKDFFCFNRTQPNVS